MIVMRLDVSETGIEDDYGIEVVIDYDDGSILTGKHVAIEEGIGEYLQKRIEFVGYENSSRG